MIEFIYLIVIMIVSSYIVFKLITGLIKFVIIVIVIVLLSSLFIQTNDIDLKEEIKDFIIEDTIQEYGNFSNETIDFIENQTEIYFNENFK